MFIFLLMIISNLILIFNSYLYFTFVFIFLTFILISIYISAHTVPNTVFEHTVPNIIWMSAQKLCLSRSEQMQRNTEMLVSCSQKPDVRVYRCIHFRRDRLSFFAEILLIFVTMYSLCWDVHIKRVWKTLIENLTDDTNA